jgi:hypothetical protein
VDVVSSCGSVQARTSKGRCGCSVAVSCLLVEDHYSGGPRSLIFLSILVAWCQLPLTKSSPKPLSPTYHTCQCQRYLPRASFRAPFTKETEAERLQMMISCIVPGLISISAAHLKLKLVHISDAASNDTSVIDRVCQHRNRRIPPRPQCRYVLAAASQVPSTFIRGEESAVVYFAVSLVRVNNIKADKIRHRSIFVERINIR